MNPFQLIDDKSAPVAASVARAYGLRPYQAEANDGIAKAWDEGITAQLVCFATGAGKTIVFVTRAKLDAQAGMRTLILAHTDELVDQAIDKAEKAVGLKPDKEKANLYASRFAKVVVGSVQTMSGDMRLSSWPKDHFARVIVDECHRSLAVSYQKILKHFMSGGALVLGVTATSDRGDKKALGDFYQRVTYDYGLLRAVRDGWLVRPLVKTMPISIDLRGVKTKQGPDGADLDRAEVGKRLVPFMDAIAGAIKAEAGAKRILIFMPSVETARIMSDALNAVQIKSNWVCGDKNLCPDRGAIVASHKSGAIQALVNMAILTEGYDDDGIEIIVCLRATKIRSLYCQIIGRGTRPHGSIVPQLNAAANALDRLNIIKSSRKPHVTLLDFLWNYEKHDLCAPASLMSSDERVVAMVKGDGDVLEQTERAERDLLAQLEKDLKKNQNKKGKVIDLFALADDAHDPTLASFTPTTPAEARPPSDKMLKILRDNQVDVSQVTTQGHAAKIVDAILDRHAKKLSTFGQIEFFKALGVDATRMSRTEATALKFKQFARWQAQRSQPAVWAPALPARLRPS